MGDTRRRKVSKSKARINDLIEEVRKDMQTMFTYRGEDYTMNSGEALRNTDTSEGMTMTRDELNLTVQASETRIKELQAERAAIDKKIREEKTAIAKAKDDFINQPAPTEKKK